VGIFSSCGCEIDPCDVYLSYYGQLSVNTISGCKWTF
jgi:hypothetical protein